MGARRRCCCECWTFSTTFTADDSTDLGSGWSEYIGDWGIENNKLVETYDDTNGTADAVVICLQAVPLRSKGEMFVQVEIAVTDLKDGGVYYLYPCCQDVDAIGDAIVSFTWNATATTWTIQISPSVSGPSTITRVQTGTPDAFVLKVCADHEYQLVKAWVSPTVNEYCAWTDVDPGEGRYAGVGHDNTDVQNIFDNFEMAELRIGSLICVECFCVCDDIPVQPLLTATITGAVLRAACLMDESWSMEAVGDGPQVFTWRGGTTINGEDLNFELRCGTGSTDFTLRWLEPWNCCNLTGSDCGPSGKTADPEASTCTPLSLVFGPYALSFTWDCDLCYSLNDPGCTGPPPISEDCAGEFYITITL